MKALVSGFSQRSSTTGVTVSTIHASTRYSAQRSKRRLRCSHSPGRNDHHFFQWRIVVALAAAGLDLGNLVHYVHAFGDTAEYRITVVAGLVIQEFVVFQVHE